MILNKSLLFQKKIIPTTHLIPIERPHLQDIIDGKKSVEGRININKYKKIRENDIIHFKTNDGSLEAKRMVKYCKTYKTFYEMLDTEGLRSVLPRERTIEDGVKLYRSMAKHWYGKNEHLGVIAFGLSEDINPKLTAQEKDVAIKTVVDEAMDTEPKALKRNLGEQNVVQSKSDFL